MNGEERRRGRVTIPTDLDVVPQTLELMERWGADAIRDCDGTDFPAALRETGAKVYATYYTTRKDNEWARQNPDEVQQCYIMTGFHAAGEGPLAIPLMQGVSPELMRVNDRDDIARWWEVIDRTSGEALPPEGSSLGGCACWPSCWAAGCRRSSTATWPSAWAAASAPRRRLPPPAAGRAGCSAGGWAGPDGPLRRCWGCSGSLPCSWTVPAGSWGSC